MIANSIVYGLVLGLLYSERDHSQLGAKETPALLYFMNLVLSKIVMTYIPEIFDQRAMFYRETASKAYIPVVYLSSLILITCFLLVITGLPIVVLTWTLAGLQSEWYKIGYMLGMGCVTPIVAYGLALFLSCSVAAPELANGLFSIVNLINSFINGYVLLHPQIPAYWIWAYWIGFQHYSLEGIILNELQGETFHCKNNDGALAIPVPSDSDPNRIRYYCPIETGEDMIEELELHSGLLLPDLLAVIALISVLFDAC
jgi:ABC-type multidrug transport system permease subunit